MLSFISGKPVLRHSISIHTAHSFYTASNFVSLVLWIKQTIRTVYTVFTHTVLHMQDLVFLSVIGGLYKLCTVLRIEVTILKKKGLV